MYHNNGFSCSGKNSAERGFSQLLADRMCTMWAVSLGHAASDTTAVRPALLMGGRGGSAVDVVFVVRGTSSSVGLLDVCWVITRVCPRSEELFNRCIFFVFKNLTETNKSSYEVYTTT